MDDLKRRSTPDSSEIDLTAKKMPQLSDDEYYIENGFYVFTEKYLKRRGYCCDSGCRHCPYKEQDPK